MTVIRLVSAPYIPVSIVKAVGGLVVPPPIGTETSFECKEDFMPTSNFIVLNTK
jgi:hypothetical protein